MSSRSELFHRVKRLAQEKRREHRVRTDSLGLREMRQIYSAEGIHIDLWPYKLRKIRAAYVEIDGEPHVLVNKSIKPVEPRLFSMAHELKHHYCDRELARKGLLGCKEWYSYAAAPEVEVSAEVFAAEFIFPEEEFLVWAESSGLSKPYSPEDVVELKRNCPARVSYSYLRKRLVRLGLAQEAALRGVQFSKLEESIHGEPVYKRVRRARSRRRAG